MIYPLHQFQVDFLFVNKRGFLPQAPVSPY
jgi:hypothetical protein